jgi:hypothetical protein
MTKHALLRKLETLMTEAERTRMYGQLEIEIKNGEAVFLRKTSTERLGMENNSDDKTYRQR